MKRIGNNYTICSFSFLKEPCVCRPVRAGIPYSFWFSANGTNIELAQSFKKERFPYALSGTVLRSESAGAAFQHPLPIALQRQSGGGVFCFAGKSSIHGRRAVSWITGHVRRGRYPAEKELDLTATLDAQLAYSNADFVVIAAPTNYDPVMQHFDKRIVDSQFLQLRPCFLVSEPILQSRGASQRRNSTDLQAEEKSAIRRMRQTTRT